MGTNGPPLKSRRTARGAPKLAVPAAAAIKPVHTVNHVKSGKGKSNARLGKGLAALFSTEGITQDNALLETAALQLQELPLSALRANPAQPRKHFAEAALAELAQSLKQVGMLQPVIARPVGVGIYELIAGERRLRAAALAKLTTLPVLVVAQEQDSWFEQMLVENIQREGLTPLEEALAYQTLMDVKKLTQADVAARVGKSRSHLANMLRLLKLPGFVQEQLRTGGLTFGMARALVGVAPQSLKPLLKAIADEGLTVRDVEARVAALRRPLQPALTQHKNTQPSADEVETARFLGTLTKELRQKLHTKVYLDPLKKNVGKLTIEYYNYEQLEELCKRMK